MATYSELRMDSGSTCRNIGNDEILGEPIAMVTRRGRLEWFGHVKEIKQKTSEQLKLQK